MLGKSHRKDRIVWTAGTVTTLIRAGTASLCLLLLTLVLCIVTIHGVLSGRGVDLQLLAAVAGAFATFGGVIVALWRAPAKASPPRNPTNGD